MLNKPNYLRLALPSPLRRLFDYLPPKGVDVSSLQVGIRVKVPFANRTLIGVLIEVVEESTVPVEKLKNAIELVDETPIIPPVLLKLCQWTAHYYQHSLGDTLSWALPNLLKQGKYPDDNQEYFWKVVEGSDLEDPRLTRATRQKRALQVLMQHQHGVAQNLIGKLQIQLDTLKRLQEKGLVACEIREIKPIIHEGSWLIEPELLANDEQEKVINIISRSLNSYQPFLLYGVTGSGKTEVYFHLIHQVLKMKKQSLVLIPEINLSPQTLHRFQKRFNAKIVLIHSNLTDKERLEAWQAAKEGRVDIVIGTRSAIFTPMAKLGLIIVDEEHDSSYKQQDGLRYHARDLAIVRAKMENVPVILGSATPSLESLHNVTLDRYRQVNLTHRAGNAKPPKIQCLDVRTQPMDSGISAQLQSLIETTLKAGQQVLIFINRRGFAPTLICHHCGWICHCPHCDARMTLHLRDHELRCHHCEYHQLPPAMCPHCHHVDLRPIGMGTERTEDRLKLLFPDWPIWRIDRDTTSRKLAMQEIVSAVKTGEAGILVGTQMLAKGHHFPNVTLVAILDADNGLFSADFRACEKTAQLIVQVAGRAGRAEQEGRVLIQTHLPDHPLILQLIDKGYLAFAKHNLEERKEAHLPPFSYFALLRAEAYKQEQLDDFLTRAHAQAEMLAVQPDNQAIEVFSPVPAPMERKAGRYRGQLLIQSSLRPVLQQYLTNWVQALEELPKTSQIRWSVDVDPIDLN
ncbi:primosomal protein N' [Entomomonas asaccharolytica]|uniref:Replication restart protein PriA n=1 Tax=Entomomonas asaccharolytica TaxID=2785331 RepID=A0A974NEZ8_9GAMM|nr:primosomal protein N' [Entomomonas asaccharolytica]QQP85272.1 primosomal protein N' [Entomomonas asaccharolytica]